MLSNLYLLLKTTSIISYGYLKYFFSKYDESHIIDICKNLSKINMFYVKMFQAISSDNNILSTELHEYLSTFTDNVPFTNDDIDNSYLEVLKKFNLKLESNEPVNSGVMSLIYVVYNENNEKMIMKVKRKNIESYLNDCIENMEFVINYLSYLPYLNTMNLNNVFKENVISFREQLDFKKEVENMRFFINKNKNIDYIEIPSVYENVTDFNENIIVMSFIDGNKLNQVKEKNKDEYCQLLAKFGVKCVFFDGVYHGDLHQGNLLFCEKDENLKIGVLDFGIIGKINREEQNLFYEFMKEFYTKNYVLAATHFLNNHVGPKELVDSLSHGERVKIINKISIVLKKIIEETKHATPDDMYTISEILFTYKLEILKYFCKVQLAFMINETVCRRLSVDKTFIEYYGELLDFNYL